MTRTDDRLSSASAVAGYVGDLPQSRYCMGLCAPTMAIEPRDEMICGAFPFVAEAPASVDPGSGVVIAAFCGAPRGRCSR
jgi:hypothetical protein